MSRWRKRRCVWRTTWTLMCVSWITYMSHTEYVTKMIMNISDSLRYWSEKYVRSWSQTREDHPLTTPTSEELFEQSGIWIELYIAHSMWDWDEMIKNTVIVYAIGPQNTFAVHRREVNEIATRVDHLRVTHVAKRR
jgi:hypothetical protein